MLHFWNIYSDIVSDEYREQTVNWFTVSSKNNFTEQCFTDDSIKQSA